MARVNDWAVKVAALIAAGQAASAIAQIRVAPDVKSLKALQAALATRPRVSSSADVQTAIADSIGALASPRLHRSP